MMKSITRNLNIFFRKQMKGDKCLLLTIYSTVLSNSHHKSNNHNWLLTTCTISRSDSPSRITCKRYFVPSWAAKFWVPDKCFKLADSIYRPCLRRMVSTLNRSTDSFRSSVNGVIILANIIRGSFVFQVLLLSQPPYSLPKINVEWRKKQGKEDILSVMQHNKDPRGRGIWRIVAAICLLWIFCELVDSGSYVLT